MCINYTNGYVITNSYRKTPSRKKMTMFYCITSVIKTDS